MIIVGLTISSVRWLFVTLSAINVQKAINSICSFLADNVSQMRTLG